MSNQIALMAQRLSIDTNELQSIVKATIMPSKTIVSNEQFTSFLAVANEYKLNPLVKEVYAFPAKGGGIQAVVSIDGWIKIASNHPDYNGMKHIYERDGKNLISVTCQIFRKSMGEPIEACEFMEECKRPTDTWKNWPTRMLRHKATIQAIRYAFGISGIVDPDEAERFNSAEKDITPSAKTLIIEDAAQEEDPNDVFYKYTDLIEDARDLGALQACFAEGYKKLKGMKADNQLVTLKDLYDEKKSILEAK